MIKLLKRLIWGETDNAAKAAAPMSEAEKKRHDESLLQRGICPECRPESPTMLLGPAGGSAHNAMCAVCRHEYNVAFINGVVLLERMGVASPERALSVYGVG